jgi:AraC family transcriptional regulator of adaptative response/methylated-DNA-[protein]-cysteine methyltransferase
MHINWTEQTRQKRGQGMVITYAQTSLDPYDEVLLAESEKGVCFIGLPIDGDFTKAMQSLHRFFPLAVFKEGEVKADLSSLDIYGTAMQISVWKELLKIKQGEVSSYKAIAEAIHKPKACRAVGNTIGANPISILIPCHRVLAANGTLGGYAWGLEQKQALLNKEITLYNQPMKAA